MKKSIIASLLIACSLFIGGNTDARAEYPYDKPINIIVPFGPGGGVDIAALEPLIDKAKKDPEGIEKFNKNGRDAG